MPDSFRLRLRAGASRTALVLLASLPPGISLGLAAPGRALAADYTVEGALTLPLRPEDRGVKDDERLLILGEIAVADDSALESALYFVTIENRGTLVQTGGLAGDATVRLLGDGAIVNAPQGLIDGAQGAVLVAGAGRLDNAGRIESQRIAVEILGGAELANSGAIAGGSDAVRLHQPSSLLNGGSITGGTVGIRLNGGYLLNEVGGTVYGSAGAAIFNSGAPLTVVNRGYLQSETDNGLELFGGRLLNERGVGPKNGVVSGRASGLAVERLYSEIINSGTIIGETEHGIDLVYGGYVMNLSGGVIEGALYGIDSLFSYTRIVNHGDIRGVDRGGILFFSGGGEAVNHGRIAGGIYGIYAALGPGKVTNYGEITASELGICFFASGEVTNHGTISGGLAGIGTDHGRGLIQNYGRIYGRAAQGVYIYAGGGEITNHAGAKIVGQTDGAVSSLGPGPVTNAGMIIGTTGFGIKMLSGGEVKNQLGGYVKGYGAGVYFSGSPGELENGGTIKAVGNGGAGLRLVAGGSLVNAAGATVLGRGYGIKVESSDSRIENGGSIAGDSRLAAFDNRQISILFAGGTDSLLLRSGSVLTGAVVGGGGRDTLELEGSGREDDDFLDFERLFVRGEWRLSGLDIETDEAVVETGLLRIDGGLGGGDALLGPADAAVAVRSGAGLGGSGSIRGDLTFDPGARFVPEVGSLAAPLIAGDSALDVSGRVVAAGAGIAVDVQGHLEDGTEIRVLRAASLVGTFGPVTDNRAFFAFTAESDATGVTLAASRDFTLEAGENGRALARTLESLDPNDPLIAALEATPEGEANSALGQASGDFHATTASTGLIAERSFLEGLASLGPAESPGRRPAALGKLAAPLHGTPGPYAAKPAGRFATWAAVEGSLGTVEDENAGDGDYAIAGGTLGADYAVSGSVRLGAAVGLASGRSETEDRGAGADRTTLRLAGYGRWSGVGASLAAAGGLSLSEVKSARATPLGPAAGETETMVLGLATEARYALALPFLTLSPLAGLSYTRLTQAAFEESGPEGASLSVGEARAESLRGSLGLVLSSTLAAGEVKLLPEVRLVYRHEFAEGVAEVANSLLADASGASFVLLGARPAADLGEVGLGLSLEMGGGISLFGAYALLAGDGQREQGASAGLRLSF